MAKKQSAAETKNTSTKSAAAKSAAPKSAAWSDVLIGDTAGQVWHVLSSGPQTVANLKKAIDAPSDLVLAAIGWLAREGKLKFDSSGRSVTISLR